MPAGGRIHSQVTLGCSSGNLPPHHVRVRSAHCHAWSRGRSIDADDLDRVDRGDPDRREGACSCRCDHHPVVGHRDLPSTLTFGPQTLNTTRSLRCSVSLTSTGADALNITNITPSGDFADVGCLRNRRRARRELRRVGHVHADSHRSAHRLGWRSWTMRPEVRTR